MVTSIAQLPSPPWALAGARPGCKSILDWRTWGAEGGSCLPSFQWTELSSSDPILLPQSNKMKRCVYKSCWGCDRSWEISVNFINPWRILLTFPKILSLTHSLTHTVLLSLSLSRLFRRHTLHPPHLVRPEAPSDSHLTPQLTINTLRQTHSSTPSKVFSTLVCLFLWNIETCTCLSSPLCLCPLVK